MNLIKTVLIDTIGTTTWTNPNPDGNVFCIIAVGGGAAAYNNGKYRPVAGEATSVILNGTTILKAGGGSVSTYDTSSGDCPGGLGGVVSGINCFGIRGRRGESGGMAPYNMSHTTLTTRGGDGFYLLGKYFGYGTSGTSYRPDSSYMFYLGGGGGGAMAITFKIQAPSLRIVVGSGGYSMYNNTIFSGTKAGDGAVLIMY